MARPDVPSLNMSFLDLLLSALGGVALLMTLFAAMQTIQSADGAKGPPDTLVFQVEQDVVGCSWRAGREVGIGVFDGTDLQPYGTDSAAAGPGGISVKWGERIGVVAYAMVKPPVGGSSVQVHAWLQQLEDAETDRLASILQGTKKLTVLVYWAKDGPGHGETTPRGPHARIPLTAAGGMAGSATLPFGGT